MRALHSLLFLSLIACGDGDDIDSDEEARRAYLALDGSIGKALQLGFDGFNTANSANIDPQATVGDDDGTLTITGQVDQGSSANKGMRLDVDMVGYTDGEIVLEDDTTIVVVFDTDPAALPALDLSLKGIPDGTLEGTLTGVFLMSGDVEGEAALNLSFAGELQESGTGDVERVPGTTTVTGTVTTPDDGSFVVDVTL